jgi:hypothetical protein
MWKRQSGESQVPMADRNLFETQRDVGPAVVSELRAAGFDDAEEIGRQHLSPKVGTTQVSA